MSPLLNKLMSYTGLSRKEAIESLSNIIACHDIGKAHPAFQGRYSNSKAYEVLSEHNLLDRSYSQDDMMSFRHEIYSGKLEKEYLKSLGFDSYTRSCIVQVQEMHHQKNTETIMPISNELVDPWHNMQDHLFKEVEDVFPLTVFSVSKDNLDAFATLLHGLEMTCDWISSNIFSDIAEDSFTNREEYYNEIVRRIHELFESQCMMEQKLPVYETMKEYIPALKPYTLTPVQAAIESVMLKIKSGFSMALIEAGTGKGKTETALYMTYYIMSHKLADVSGFYYGLPTSATSSAMQPRLQKMLRDLGLDDNVFLYTGNAWMKEADTPDVRKLSSEQKFLRQFACGTVDQMMAKFHLIKHGAQGLTALASKVVIIDEMHAYDAYMRGTLVKMLTWLKELGAPVIILSATLPSKIKRQIFDVYSNKEVSLSKAYPLITVCNEKGTYQFPVEEQEISKSYKIEELQIAKSPEKIAQEALRSVRSGGCCGVILNTVKKTKAVYKELKKIAGDDVLIEMIRGNAPEDYKSKRTEEVLSHYGKDRSSRPKKAVVVATQILEQSIDIDLDFLYTEICPIDLLIQRIGRYRRHSDVGTIREGKELENVVTVLTGDMYLMYAEVIIKNTLKVLHKKPFLSIPEDLRKVMDIVYDHISTANKEGRVYLSEEQHALADSAADEIDAPSHVGKFSLYYKRNELCSDHAQTRKSDYEQEAVVLALDDMFKKIKEDNGKASKQDAIKLISSGAFGIFVNQFEKDVEGGMEAIEGSGWLTNRKILRLGEKYVIDPMMGPCSVDEL